MRGRARASPQGRLVAEYLARTYESPTAAATAPRVGSGAAPREPLRWAIAGRSRERLEAVRASLGDDGEDVGVLVADSHDDDSLAALCSQTSVIATTIGPYAEHGAALVEQCVANGTDVCDLTGEPQFVRRSIDAHHVAAARRGVRIVHCCGYDSVPSDIGALIAVQEAKRAAPGEEVHRVDYLHGPADGGVSGGTIASIFNLLENEPLSVVMETSKPYYLAEGEAGPDCGTLSGVSRVRPLGNAWAGPFFMAGINELVVRRSVSLQPKVYPKDLLYHERQVTGRGAKGLFSAVALSLGTMVGMALLAIGPLRRAIRRWLPSQGEGPTKEKNETGYFNITLVAQAPSGKELSRVAVRGTRDPGYGATAAMLGEAAVGLARTRGRTPPDGALAGGVLTPATALSTALADRLNAVGIVTFAASSAPAAAA